ncbi:PREDICTED: ubiquinol-cytochrome-c reductase complex assembly factor 1 isoform X1 [Polistes canadensis]|uniref:ubiquinol-cytochrome-c reductase complex assembly factor 1 isoform X1 n=2 Tax=Polistes canadensis TaxID=91411 RepID=UPI000718E621|nr:PREDICTED: ubiquinol-cytochrome-c reductase complex assembly factor 1 isoform X1 [Polistes canadensis]
MQYSRTFLSIKSIVPLLRNNNCIQCGNIKLWKHGSLVYVLHWPTTRFIHTTTTIQTSIVEKMISTTGIKRISNWIKDKVPFFDIEVDRAKTFAYSEYEYIVDKIDYPAFFKDFNMPDTFYSWFLVTELHVWMLMVRFMAEGKYGKIARNTLVEALWDDVEMRSKKLGEMSSSIRRKQKQDLSYQFNAAILAYDEGIMSDDKVLASALWGTFFNLECNNPEHIEKLIIYVRKQINHLDKIPSQKILRHPQIKWLELKKINIDDAC